MFVVKLKSGTEYCLLLKGNGSEETHGNGLRRRIKRRRRTTTTTTTTIGSSSIV